MALAKSSSAVFCVSWESPLSEHSQISKTFQPAAINCTLTRSSLFRFDSIFSVQNSLRVLGTLNRWQVWPCQKHPWTKTTAQCFGNTTSGRPGSPLPPSLKRSPRAWRPLRTINSSLVSAPRIRDICTERWAGVRLSANVSLWSASLAALHPHWTHRPTDWKSSSGPLH